MNHRIPRSDVKTVKNDKKSRISVSSRSSYTVLLNSSGQPGNLSSTLQGYHEKNVICITTLNTYRKYMLVVQHSGFNND